MKKLTCILMVSILLCGLMLSVSAAPDPAESYDWADAVDGTPTLSDDFMTLTIDGETYHRMDTTYLDYSFTRACSIALSETQQLQVKDAMLETDNKQIIAAVYLTYQDGSTLWASYVKDSQRERLTALLEDENTTAWVQFYTTYAESALTAIKNFKGTPVQLDQKFLHYCEQFTVYGINYNINIRSILGVVLTHDGKFYYVDAQETGCMPYEYNLSKYHSLDAYEITNEALLTALEENTEEYYSDGVGMLYDDAFTEVLSIAVLLLVFGILPFGLLILAVILLIRNKGYQRKTWAVTAGLAAGELVVFGALVGIFVNLIGK